jgi:hypothetical protein
LAGGQIKFEIYQPDLNYSKHFLHVTIWGIPGTSSTNWDDLVQLAHKEMKKGDKKGQHKYKDFEMMGGHCTTQVGSEVEAVKLSKKPGTNDVCIIEAMLVLS